MEPRTRETRLDESFSGAGPDEDALLSRIIEAANPMVVVDEAGWVVLVNARAEILFGRGRRDLIGRPIDDLLPERFRDGHRESVRDFRARQRLRPMGTGLELLALRSDGAEVPVEVGLYPLVADGRRYILASVADVSQRRRDEEATRLLAAIVEGSNDAILSKTLDGTILSWNRGAQLLYGYTPEEIVGTPIARLVPPERLTELDEIHRRLRAGERIEELETVRVTRDGRRVDVRVTISPIFDSHGRITAASAIAHDIGQRKRAEEALSAKTRDLETLLYVASHDLREPLRAIDNFARILNERYHEQIDAKGRDFLFRIVRAAGRLDRLLDDILGLSRVQRMAPPEDWVSGREIVNAAMALASGKIRETGARVRTLDPFPVFRVSRRWAIQAIYNLLLNALKFTVEDTAPDIEIAAYRDGGIAGIVVRDRGPGIAPEHRERIFQLFQRAVPRTVEGTGAGLAIVRQIAERHGGRAWAQPRGGGGAEFVVTFRDFREATDPAGFDAPKGDDR